MTEVMVSEENVTTKRKYKKKRVITRLLEVFTEYQPVLIGRSTNNKYYAEFTLIPTGKSLTLEDLYAYVRRLNEKFPTEQFYVEKIIVDGRELYVVDKARRTWRKKKVPLYFDLANQKIYVEERDVNEKPKLVNYLLMRALGMMGLAKTKYVRSLGRAE